MIAFIAKGRIGSITRMSYYISGSAVATLLRCCGEEAVCISWRVVI